MASEFQVAPRQRLWLGATLALILAVGALTFAFFWRQQQNATYATSLEKVEAQVARQNARLELTDEQKATRLARAKFLRAKWRVWALAHQNELKQMLNAKPDDQATFSMVWNSIPAVTAKPSDGINSKDLRPEDALLQGVAYTWNPIGKVKAAWQTTPTTEDLSRAALSKNYQGAKLQQDFEQLRDIEISSSVNHGKTKLCLWVSGRITERTYISGKPTTLPNGVKYPAQEIKEIVPPYDFLRN